MSDSAKTAMGCPIGNRSHAMLGMIDDFRIPVVREGLAILGIQAV
jgi:hypothetical protein